MIIIKNACPKCGCFDFRKGFEDKVHCFKCHWSPKSPEQLGKEAAQRTLRKIKLSLEGV